MVFLLGQPRKISNYPGHYYRDYFEMGIMKFKIFQNRKGQWYFRYVASNGEKLFVSEGYHNKGDMLDTIDLIKNTAPTAPVEEVLQKKLEKL